MPCRRALRLAAPAPLPAAAKTAVLGLKIGTADGVLLLPGIGKVSGHTAAIMLGMTAWSVNCAGCLVAMPGVPSDIYAALLRDGKLSGNVASELKQVLRQSDELKNDLLTWARRRRAQAALRRLLPEIAPSVWPEYEYGRSAA